MFFLSLFHFFFPLVSQPPSIILSCFFSLLLLYFCHCSHTHFHQQQIDQLLSALQCFVSGNCSLAIVLSVLFASNTRIILVIFSVTFRINLANTIRRMHIILCIYGMDLVSSSYPSFGMALPQTKQQQKTRKKTMT